MTRIGVITDAHANLPATVAALAALDAVGCDQIVHTGDAIAIGPHPREVMELLLGRTDLVLLMGNHDELFGHDLLQNPPMWLPPGQTAHEQWTHDQLRGSWRDDVAQWQRSYDLVINDVSIRFQHYALNNGEYGPVSRDNIPEELDASFRPETEIVFFGHHHPTADVQGSARYINPGALGTNPEFGARYAVIEGSADGGVDISLHSVPYDADIARRDLVARNVPEAEFLLKKFLT